MAAREYNSQIKDRDPQVRIKGIKAAAKAVDRKVLNTLAHMCEEDPDQEVRDIARRAGVYIRQQLGELPTANGANGAAKPNAPAKVKVTPEIEEAARKYTDMAIALHIEHQVAKAMKMLQKALQTNPNLREDAYFKSVVDNITGATGEEAMNLVLDSRARAEAAQKEVMQKKQHVVDNHLQEIKKASWPGVLFDTVMLFGITFGAIIFAVLLLSSNARGYLAKYEASVAKVNAAIASGHVVQKDDGTIRYLDYEVLGPLGDPTEFDAIIPEAGFWVKVNQFAALDFVGALLAGLLAAGLITGGALIAGPLVHAIGAGMLRGKGNLPYTMQRVLNFWGFRMGLIGVLVGVGSFIPYELAGTNVGFFIVIGLIAVILLMSLLKLMTNIGLAYNFSSAMGLIAGLPVILLVGGVIVYGLLQLI